MREFLDTLYIVQETKMVDNFRNTSNVDTELLKQIRVFVEKAKRTLIST